MNTSNTSPASAPSTPITTPVLERMVMSALERTAFVMAEPAPDADASAEHSGLATRLSFRGAAEGECLFTASEGFVRELTAGFLGVEPTEVDIDAQGQDALNELANIVSGLVIRELGNASHRIFLGLPTPADPTKLAPAPGTQPVTCRLDSCGETLSVTIIIQQQHAQAA